MVESEHVRVVKEGSLAIKAWRGKNPGVRLELSKAALRGIKLSNARLSKANLSQADLSKAELNGANLQKANLAAADLSGAVISGAQLTQANLSEANLSGATLSKARLSQGKLSGANLANADLCKASLLQANLSQANLSGANFSEADLTGARLVGANFSRANLSKAKLVAGNLSAAKLPNANLSRASLVGANCSQANFSQADLSGARLVQTRLSGADLTFVKLGNTSIYACDLGQCLGLHSVQHEAPSAIGVDTLIASFRTAVNKHDLMVFFRGAGVPHELLRALPDLIEGIQFYTCFISYGGPDEEFAKKLRDDLVRKGVPTWLYSMDYTPGERTWHEIGQKRREAEKMVVLCSAQALVRDGVLKELEEQIDDSPEKIVPISLDELWKHPGFRVIRASRDLKPFLIERNYADFSDPAKYEESLNRLLKGLTTMRKGGHAG